MDVVKPCSIPTHKRHQLFAHVRVNSQSIVCFSVTVYCVRVCIIIQIKSDLDLVALRIDDSKRIFVCHSFHESYIVIALFRLEFFRFQPSSAKVR